MHHKLWKCIGTKQNPSPHIPFLVVRYTVLIFSNFLIEHLAKFNQNI